MMRNVIVDIACTLRRPTEAGRRVPFARIARALLPRAYTLSVLLTGDSYAQRLNKTYKKNNRAPNVLAFPLSQTEGEVVINIRKVEREVRQFNRDGAAMERRNVSVAARTAYLFIHALLHLRGYRHGRTMESIESAVLHKFNIE